MKIKLLPIIAIQIFLFYSLGLNSQIISNPSFEKGENNLPSGWVFETWDKVSNCNWTEPAYARKKSVSITNERKGWGHIMCKVRLKPYSRYRFGGWIKTENVVGDENGGAIITIGNFDIPEMKTKTGTNVWQKIEFEFDSKGDDSGVIECILGANGIASGKAWFDDIILELISSRKLSPDISIDVKKTKEPMSEYIYGQFIEHLGKCIYGGIWAEVIMDRKFYYIPGNKESVWKVTGLASCIKMAASPYVGQNTPEIITSGDQLCGIEQENIPLIKDMVYNGHIVIAGKLDKAKLSITLKWGEKESEKQTISIDTIDDNYQKIPIKFNPGLTTEKGGLTIEVEGNADVRIGTLSLMPANNISGFRADVIALLKELNSPVYRWPGGNFVSGYNWKDGIGDPDRRPPRKNPAWSGIEHNDVGIEEFMKFCKILNTEPYIALNSGLGGVLMATEEVEYCNGAVGTTMGHLRADNGSPDPYKVKFWAVGNEMFGDWQLGNMPVEEYVKKNNEFAAAIWKIDSTGKLIAVGNAGEWDKMMLSNCANNMDYISEHIYRQDWHGGGLMTHTKQLADDIRNIGETHRKYRNEIPALKGKDIRIAMDEWNYWYGPHIFGELGTRYFWRDGMGIAAGLNEYSRNSDIYFMANYAQTVNVIGCIKTTGIAAAFETTGLVLKMYRQYFGEIPVELNGSPEPLDVAATLTKDSKFLTIAVMNPTADIQTLKCTLHGFSFNISIDQIFIQNDDDMIYNDPTKGSPVTIKTAKIQGFKNVKISPKSVNIFRLEISK